MQKVVAAFVAVMTCVTAAAVVPNVNDLRPVPQYPAPAAGASIVLGVNQSVGPLILWDGDNVYLQEFVFAPGPLFNVVASGYLGDPSFVDLQSNDRTAVFGDGAAGLVYQLDVLNPTDFVAGVEISVPTFTSAVLLNDVLLLLDRMKSDLSGAELVVVDLSTARAVPLAGQVVLEKPPGSTPAGLHIDPVSNRLFIMDGTTRELRSFAPSALITAFTGMQGLSWTTDGTPIGLPGQFLNGGVGAVNLDGELIIGGSAGAPATGGIQFVDATATVLATLDPAGTAPPYAIVFNQALDELIAIDPTVAPPVAYATTIAIPAIPPDSPCQVFDTINAQFATFLATFSPLSNDLDLDQIPDTAMLQLIELFSCRDDSDPLVLSSNSAYDDNLEAFDLEASAASLGQFREVIAVLMLMNQAMQDSVRALLAANATPLTGTYEILTCTDPQTCLPPFIEDPLRAPAALPRAINEQYSADGDPDGDGFSNLVEYMNVAAMGGDDFDFAIAAASDLLDGTPGLRGGGSGGACFIATAAYGTPLAGEIDVLRRIRDTRMLPNAVGAALADLYYRLSPAAAQIVARNPALQAPVRAALVPVVRAAAWDPAAWWAVAVLMAGLALAMLRRRRERPRD